MDNSEPRSICTFCLNSAFLRLIRLSFSPTLPSALHYYLSLCLLHLAQLVSIWIRKLPRFFRLYLRVSIPFFPLRRLVGLFRCRFDKCNVQACALAACTVSVISTNDVAYLPGLPLRVPRRLWKVRDSNSRSVLPLASLAVRCFRPLSQPSQYVYPDCSLF